MIEVPQISFGKHLVRIEDVRPVHPIYGAL